MNDFPNNEMVIILKCARIALADGEIFDEIAEEFEISDDYLKEIQEKIYSLTT